MNLLVITLSFYFVIVVIFYFGVFLLYLWGEGSKEYKKYSEFDTKHYTREAKFRVFGIKNPAKYHEFNHKFANFCLLLGPKRNFNSQPSQHIITVKVLRATTMAISKAILTTAVALYGLCFISDNVVLSFFIPVPTKVPGYRLPLTLGSSKAEKILENPQWPKAWPFNDDVDFSRQDESTDSIFYDAPRLCYHIDDAAVSALTEYYSKNLKSGDDVLDICSSWISHYPKDFKGGKVVGLGMNEYELSQNPALTDFVVKDLNSDPVFPFEDSSFDKVTCVVSVDYLNKPLQVFKEIGRVLRPGGECLISMSNRCFPTKAFQVSYRRSYATT